MMKKSIISTSKRTFNRKLEARIETIRKEENMNAMINFPVNKGVANYMGTAVNTQNFHTISNDQQMDFSVIEESNYGNVHDSNGPDLELAEVDELVQRSEFGFDVFAYIKSLDFKLRKWAIKNFISLSALSELLAILKKEGNPSLPKDGRTLLQTPKTVTVIEMGTGEYWYGGLEQKLLELCKVHHQLKTIKLTFHIDGTPIYKSSKSEFWPVQCNINEIEMDPFFVAIFKGPSKPASAELFLRPLLDELHVLLCNGLDVLQNGEISNIGVEVEKFILDAPARAFLKCIIGHSGYFSCERCEEEGEFLSKDVGSKTKSSKRKAKGGHVCLIGTNAPLRTDQSFRNQDNEDHHHDSSPLEELPIDMVRDIPLEYMHLILLGIMKRLLHLWISGTKQFKFSETDISEISIKHTAANRTQPSEINRANRSLNCLSFWKATEYRTFLLKTGPVILREHLTAEMYNHFMALHCAVSICSSSSLKKYIPVAKMLFRSFAERFGEIYGDENKTYSTHSVIHVTDDVERFGSLDQYSAFPGESNLGFLKKLVRGGHLPLQQVVKRINERNSCRKICKFEETQNTEEENLSKNVLRLKGLRLDCTEKNRWLLTKKKEIFRIDRILKGSNGVQFEGGVLSKENQENLYDLPIESKDLFCFTSKLDATLSSISFDDMFCKLYIIEMASGKFAFIPLFHTIK